MKAEIISIGTELLLGEITDTNSSFIAGQLPLLGIDVYFISTVGDNQQRLVATLKQAWERSDIIITTGGLGPTQGDITRESIAALLNENLSTNTEAVENLRNYFCHRKLDMPQANLKQARVIPSSTLILNNRGTAPGWWVEKNGHIIISMPGPPYEMQNMWNNEILPKLRQKTAGGIIVSRTIKTFGLGEAKVSELICPYFSSSNPTLGIYAKRDGIHIRITAKGENQERAESLIKERELELRNLLLPYIWGQDSDTLENIVSKLFIKKKLNLSIMESETGGFLANVITSIPESTLFFKGGLVAPSSESKIAFGVEQGLISRFGSPGMEVSIAMASAAKEILHSDIGIGITAVTNPEFSQNNILGSIFIGIDDGTIKHKIARNSPGTFDVIKQRAAISTLFELIKILSTGGTNAPDN